MKILFEIFNILIGRDLWVMYERNDSLRESKERTGEKIKD